MSVVIVVVAASLAVWLSVADLSRQSFKCKTTILHSKSKSTNDINHINTLKLICEAIIGHWTCFHHWTCFYASHIARHERPTPRGIKINYTYECKIILHSKSKIDINQGLFVDTGCAVIGSGFWSIWLEISELKSRLLTWGAPSFLPAKCPYHHSHDFTF